MPVIFISMPRKKRHHFNSALYHVMLRGNNDQAIFFDDINRCRLCLLVNEACCRFGCQVHAFCWMSNHIHLAIQVDNVPLSKIMHNIACRYAKFINN